MRTAVPAATRATAPVMVADTATRRCTHNQANALPARAAVDDDVAGHALPPLAQSQLQQLRVCPVHPKESALDVPLRLDAPVEMRCVALRDAPSAMPLAWRLAALLKGSAANTTATLPRVTVTPATALTCGDGNDAGCEVTTGDASVVHVDTAKDARARVAAALRAGADAQAGKLLCTLGALHYNSGNVDACHSAFAQALPLFTRVHDGVGVVYCSNVLGVCCYRRGEYAASLPHHARCRDMGDSYVRAVALLNMGVSYAALHELARAQDAFADACAEAMAAGDDMLEAIARGNGGLVALRAGHLREAHDSLERCLQQCSVAGDANGAALCLLLLGDVCARAHDHHHAVFYYEQAYRVGGEADNADVVDVARVRVGVARGVAALKESVLQQAVHMGRSNDAHDILHLLPPSP